MRILHFSSVKTWRGGEQQIAYLYEELQTRAIHQWIFCVAESALAAFCHQKNIPHFTYKKRFSTNPSVAFKLKKICIEQKISLVHLHDSHSHTFAYMAALFGNVTPLILSRRVDFPVQKNCLSYQKYNHTSIKRIISVSHYVQQVLSSTIQHKEKLDVVHSGIDISRFQQVDNGILRTTFAIPEGVQIIANIAAIAPHKDYFTFVDTAEILLQKNRLLRFFIIGGDGGEAEAIRAYITQKGLTDYFILTGFREDIPQILPEISVLLFTSKTEGLGTTLLDALASGVPIVATATGGVPEIIQDKTNGHLAPIKNAFLLAQKVEYLLKNPIEKNQLVERGKDTVLQFSKEKMATKTLEIYEEILR